MQRRFLKNFAATMLEIILTPCAVWWMIWTLGAYKIALLSQIPSFKVNKQNSIVKTGCQVVIER